MKLIDLTCPHCQAQLKVDSKREYVFCEYCGAKILIDDEINHFQIDNAEETGYRFEKGRQRAQAEARKNQSVYYQSPEPKKKRKTWLWVLGWIFLFPVPLTILLLRKKEMNPALKYGIIAVAWIAYFLVAVSGKSDSTDKTVTEQPSSSMKLEATQSNLAQTVEKDALSALPETKPTADIQSGHKETIAPTAPIEPIEMNSLQTLFASLTNEMSRDEIDAYISDNGMVKYAFTQDSAYYIGYHGDAIRQRGRDREGEAVDIDFVTSGDSGRMGKVQSAQYAIHTGFSTHYALKFKDGIFYYEGEACSSGEEAMQRFLAATQNSQ